MSTITDIRVADEVFIATALLHREQPDRPDFTVSEIVERAKKEDLTGELRPGVYVHASLHCVANKAPNPGKYRILYATGTRTRRLLRSGDDVHPLRDGKIWPNPQEIPPQFHKLIDWAQANFDSPSQAPPSKWLNSVLELRGTGKDLWAGDDPDQYVRSLREGWE
jgi:hypothetical protein